MFCQCHKRKELRVWDIYTAQLLPTTLLPLLSRTKNCEHAFPKKVKYWPWGWQVRTKHLRYCSLKPSKWPYAEIQLLPCQIPTTYLPLYAQITPESLGNTHPHVLHTHGYYLPLQRSSWPCDGASAAKHKPSLLLQHCSRAWRVQITILRLPLKQMAYPFHIHPLGLNRSAAHSP